MKKYLFVYNMNSAAMQDAQEAVSGTREETMKEWHDWASRLGDNLVDLGNPAMPGVRMKQKGDAGKAETELAGYSLVQAEDLDGAKSYLDNHPHLHWSEHTSIDIHELMPM